MTLEDKTTTFTEVELKDGRRERMDDSSAVIGERGQLEVSSPTEKKTYAPGEWETFNSKETTEGYRTLQPS